MLKIIFPVTMTLRLPLRAKSTKYSVTNLVIAATESSIMEATAPETVRVTVWPPLLLNCLPRLRQSRYRKTEQLTAILSRSIVVSVPATQETLLKNMPEFRPQTTVTLTSTKNRNGIIMELTASDNMTRESIMVTRIQTISLPLVSPWTLPPIDVTLSIKYRPLIRLPTARTVLTALLDDTDLLNRIVTSRSLVLPPPKKPQTLLGSVLSGTSKLTTELH